MKLPKGQAVYCCPFCGETHSLYIKRKDTSFAVRCNYTKGGCGATAGFRTTIAEAIELWNTREQGKIMYRVFLEHMNHWTENVSASEALVYKEEGYFVERMK